MDINQISPSQRNKILETQEGHFYDLKSKEIRPAKLSRTISAFANADGGEIFVGIREENDKSRVWDGFEDMEAANGHLQAFETVFPLGHGMRLGFLECEDSDGLVLHIEVPKTKDIKFASDSTPYVRLGAQNHPASNPTALKKLEYAKGVSSFESQTVRTPLDRITNSEPIIEFMLQVVPTAEPENWLRKQEMIVEDMPTVAGVLLFSEEPQAILPKQCAIKVYRYTTTEEEGFREALAFTPLTIEGPLYQQIADAVSTTAKIVERDKIAGESTLESIKYPVEAIHEIVTNAVIHREYSVTDDIHIRVFDNRIEVESPGRLPGHITPKNILQERLSRNGMVQRMLNKYPDPPNQDVGEGLATAFSAMRKLGLKEPVITESKSSVLVSIRHEPLASPETAILDYLSENPTIKNKKAREICHVQGDYIIKETFKRMVKMGLIEKVPGTRTSSTAYRLPVPKEEFEFGDQIDMFESDT